MDCTCTVAALAPDESSRVDLATRDLDVYRINAVVESLRQDLCAQELGVCRDPAKKWEATKMMAAGRQ